MSSPGEPSSPSNAVEFEKSAGIEDLLGKLLGVAQDQQKALERLEETLKSIKGVEKGVETIGKFMTTGKCFAYLLYQVLTRDI